MQYSKWIWLGGLFVGSPAFGQDQPQAAVEGKSDPAEQLLTIPDIQQRNEYRTKLINGQRALGKARSELETAQRRLQELRRQPPMDRPRDQAERSEANASEEVAQAQHKLDVARSDLDFLAQMGWNLGLVRRFVAATPAQPLAPNQPTEFVTTHGLDFVEADAVLRSQLGLPTGQGLVVVRITPGGLAEQAGLQEKDLILKLNGQPALTAAQATEVIAKVGSGAVRVELIRRGKPIQLSLVGPNHGQPSGPTNYWIGVPVSPVDATLRSHLTALPADAGLVVTDVVADSPAAKGGIQQTDILIRCNEKLLTSQEVLVEQVQKSGGEAVKFEALRGGKIITVNVVPEKRPVTNAQTLNDLVKDLNVAVGNHLMYRTVPYYNASMGRTAVEPQFDAIVVNPNVYGTTRNEVIPDPSRLASDPNQVRSGWRFTPMPDRNSSEDREIRNLARRVDELRKMINELKQQQADKKPATQP